MNPLIPLVAILAIIVIGGLAYLYWMKQQESNGSTGLSNMRASFTAGLRSASTPMREGAEESAVDRRKRSVLQSKAFEGVSQKKAGNRLTLERRLRYAQWPITPTVFRVIQICAASFVMSLASLKLEWVLVIAGGMIAMLITNGVLTYAVERRFKAFDADYPSFLLSVVGLLKTGMNATGALEAAAKGLAEASLMREEVELMIERLRFGVPEDTSIGAFAEDIYHPEIELFVQALLLSRRVGGTLSDTLERLSKQVRKRQFFRASAESAVGLQRGSIWFIIGILASLEVYMYFVYPVAVVGAWNDPTGWKVWQYGILVILGGIYWVRQVTKLKI